MPGQNASYLLVAWARDGEEMKTGREQTDTFLMTRMGLYGWMRDEGRQLRSLQTLPFPISDWKMAVHLLHYFDFRGWELLLCLSQPCDSADRLLSFPAKKARLHWIILKSGWGEEQARVRSYTCLVPAAFCTLRMWVVPGGLALVFCLLQTRRFAVYGSEWMNSLLSWHKQGASKVVLEKNSNSLQGMALWKAGKWSSCLPLGHVQLSASH